MSDIFNATGQLMCVYMLTELARHLAVNWCSCFRITGKQTFLQLVTGGRGVLNRFMEGWEKIGERAAWFMEG